MIKSRPVYELLYFAVCEECGTLGPESFSENGARKQAKKHGWKLADKEDDDWYCPEHVDSPQIAERAAEKNHRRGIEGRNALIKALTEFADEQKAKEANDPSKDGDE